MMSYYLRPLAILVVLFLLAGTTALSAQESGNALGEDARAFQFRILPSATSGLFDGGVISMKHHTSENTAIGYGISFNGEYREQDGDGTRSDLLGGAYLHFLSYPGLAGNPNRDVQFFWGVGPALQYGVVYRNPELGESTTEHAWGLGIGGTIGAEWFFGSRISLTAEYQSVLALQVLPDEWAVGLLQQGVRFGTSMYF